MASRSADPLKTTLCSFNRKKKLHCNNESENLPTQKILMKIDLNINLFNSPKTGNCDSENLVSHIFSTQEHAQRFPKKYKSELIKIC